MYGIGSANDYFNPKAVISVIEELLELPVLKGGYLYSNERPGLGLDIDEKRAALLIGEEVRQTTYHHPYPVDRKADGTVVRP